MMLTYKFLFSELVGHRLCAITDILHPDITMMLINQSLIFKVV